MTAVPVMPAAAALLLCACAPQQPATPAPIDPACPFDLSQPLRTFELPEPLHELSAITVVDAHTVACVQDEKGVLFLFDLDRGVIAAEHRFGERGDYEGLARAGSDYFVLRSDGLLLQLDASTPHLRCRDELRLGLPLPEFEGICLDAGGQRLWIAPKEFGHQGKEHRDERPLFQFDLASKRALPQPALTLSVAAVEQKALQLRVELPSQVTAKGKERVELQLHFSDIAVRPGTGDLYLLSAVDHLLVVVSPTAAVRFVHHVDERLLPQPESIAFLPDGDLLLGSEGGDGVARLCRYKLAAK